MNLDLHNTHLDFDLFDEIQPFFINVVETFQIVLPKSFNSSDKENFRNKVAHKLESNSNSVSFYL